MGSEIGKRLLARVQNEPKGPQSMSIKIEAATIAVLEQWPQLGHSHRERAANLIEAGDEYLRWLREKSEGSRQ